MKKRRLIIAEAAVLTVVVIWIYTDIITYHMPNIPMRILALIHIKVNRPRRQRSPFRSAQRKSVEASYEEGILTTWEILRFVTVIS